MEIRDATPAIVSPAEFQSAQACVLGPRTREFAAPRKNLLYGHVYCGICGGRLTGSVQQGKYPYYHCRHNWHRYGGTCTQRYVKAESLEQASWQAVSDVLERPEIIIAELHRNQDDGAPFLKEEKRSLIKRIASATEQEKRLVKLFSVGEIDEALIVQEMKALKAKRDASGVRLKEVEQELPRLTRLQVAEPKVEEVCRMIRTKLAVMTFDGKRLAMEGGGWDSSGVVLFRFQWAFAKPALATCKPVRGVEWQPR